jgi:hypothetical protein
MERPKNRECNTLSDPDPQASWPDIFNPLTNDEALFTKDDLITLTFAGQALPINGGEIVHWNENFKKGKQGFLVVRLRDKRVYCYPSEQVKIEVQSSTE